MQIYRNFTLLAGGGKAGAIDQSAAVYAGKPSWWRRNPQHGERQYKCYGIWSPWRLHWQCRCWTEGVPLLTTICPYSYSAVLRHYVQCKMQLIVATTVLVSSYVCLCVCLLVTTVSCSQTPGPIEMSFWVVDLGGSKEPYDSWRPRSRKRRNGFLNGDPLSVPFHQNFSICCYIYLLWLWRYLETIVSCDFETHEWS